MVALIRHIVTRVLRAFGACMACLVLHGCIYDDTSLRGDTDGDIVQVGFRIRLSEEYGTRVAGTRADGSELPPDYDDPAKYENGTGYENYIGIANNDFSFLLFDGDGKFVETMTVLGIFPVGYGEYSTEYTVLCSVTKKPGGTFKVMALANWGGGNYPYGAGLTEGVTTIGDVCEGAGRNNTFVYAPAPGIPFVPSAETPIPMYGVKTSDVKLEAGRVNDIGDVYLLRAMAKVEVVCREGSDLELASVRLTGYNTMGFSAPAGMYDNTVYVSEPHIPAGAVVDGTSIDFRISGNKAVIYIPEYRNKTTAAEGSATPCRLFVTFVDNADRTYTVDFCKYEDGKATDERFDILRNVCYRFTVDKLKEFEVDVIPYGVRWLDPVFGLD